VKANRDEALVQAALDDITNATEDDQQNLLEKAVIAARHRATLGEISAAMEKTFGRYKATIRAIEGVYRKEISMDEDFQKACGLADQFAEKVGRRPRCEGDRNELCRYWV